MLNDDDLKELASQLRQPNGAKGIEVASTMNETNRRMTIHSIDCLDIATQNRVLELGHGSAAHLEHLFHQHNNITYYGLETSVLMHEEAKRINKHLIDREKASFYLYDGINMPFSDLFFDRIFTVNTVYFWNDPVYLLNELYRVVTFKGLVNITFAQKDFMQRLPFTQFGFELYDNAKISELIKKTKFEIVSTDTQIETIKSKTGDVINRDFTTITLTK